MSEPLVVQSHVGPYTVRFDEGALPRLDSGSFEHLHFFVDARVAELYRSELAHVLDAPSVQLVEANEESKSLERLPGFVEQLVANGIRRGHVLVAVGGGVVQDIVCFLAAVTLRGVEWRFFPTTLLAQADSCIGSKSSINVGSVKNLLGTFTPPGEVTVDVAVLRTLELRELRSGAGEMLKVHAIEGPSAFDEIARDYPRLFEDEELLVYYVRRSLEIKRRIIEVDEFDQGVRNVMNYGHSFGHAIESATSFAVPHGIAVTIGMDVANFVAAGLDLAPRSFFEHLHPTLMANAAGYERTPVEPDALLGALAKDKKNTDRELRLILPDETGHIGVRPVANDGRFRTLVHDYLTAVRA